MKLKLIDLGRNNVNAEVEIKKPSFTKVLKQVKQHILTKYPDIMTTDDPQTFEVVCGFRAVGKIWVEDPTCMNQ